MPSEEAEKLRILIVPSEFNANASCPGYPQFAPSERCPYPGWCLEIMSVLLRFGKIPHEFVIDRNDTEFIDWGRLKDDGHFSGVLGRIESGEVDMACLFFQKSVLRLAHFDYSVLVTEIQPTFIIREIPGTLWSVMFNYMQPYPSSVWVGMLVALIVQMILWSVIGRLEIHFGLRQQRANGEYFFWDVFDELFNGGDHSFIFLSGKLARLILVVFQKGLFLGMYTALLLTALVTPADNVPIKSKTDAIRLIKSGEFKLISDRSKWFGQEMELSSEQLFADLREATRYNPVVQPTSDEEALDLVNQGGYIYQTQNDEDTMIEMAGKCYTLLFSKGLPFRSAHLLFRKGSPWIDVLNAQIMRNYAFIDQVYNRYFEQRQRLNIKPKCDPDMFAPSRAEDPLNFWSVTGIFMLGACGLIISITFLVVEVIISHVYRAL